MTEKEPAMDYLECVARCLKTPEGRAALRMLVELPPVDWQPTPEAK